MGLDAPFIKIITKIDEASYESVRKKINNIFKSANSRQIKIKFKLDTKELNEITKKVTSQKDKEVKVTTTADTKGITEVENRLKSVENEVDKTNNKTVKVKSDNSALEKTQSLLAKFGDVARMQALTGVFRLLTSSIHLAGEAIFNLDKAQTEYNKVTELTNKQMKYQIDGLQSMGKEVGRTTSEMIEGTTGWKKAGFSDADAAKLSKITALYQNTADEVLSTSQATDILTSVIKAYNISADDAIQVTDKINNVSAKFAVSSGDLGNGLKVSSASMSTFGNSIDQTMGMLTAGTTIFQHQSSRVARGLNTVAINITKNKDALAKYGINVEDANGHLKSTYDVLDELKPKWDAMTDAERTSLGQTLAGKNQYAILTAVLSKWKEAQDAVTASQDSAGTTMQQNARYMESLEAKVQNLKAAFERLVTSNGGLGSMAKLFLDLGADALNLISNLGGLPPVLISIGGAFALIKADKIGSAILTAGEKFKSFGTTAKSVGIAIKNCIVTTNAMAKENGLLNAVMGQSQTVFNNFRAGLEGFKASLSATSAQNKELATSTLTAKGSLKGLSAEEKEAAIQAEATTIAQQNLANVIGMALGGISIALGIGMMAYSKYKQTQEEAARAEEESFQASQQKVQKYQDALKVIKDETSTRKELISAIDGTDDATLKEIEGIKDSNKLRDEAIKKINEQIKAEYELEKAKIHDTLNVKGNTKSSQGYANDTVKLVGTDMIDNKQSNNRVSKVRRTAAKDVYSKDINKQQKALATLIKEYNKLADAKGRDSKEGKKYQKAAKDLSNTYQDNAKKIDKAIDSSSKYEKQLDKADKKKLKQLRNAKKESQAILNGEKSKQKATKGTTKELSKQEKEQQRQQKRQKQITSDSKKSIKQLSKEYSKLYNVSNKQLSKNMDNIRKFADQYGMTISEAMDTLGYSTQQAGDQIDDAYKHFQDLEQAFQDSVGSIGDLGNAYSNLTEACAEYNEQGYLNFDTLTNILNQSPEYLACLDMEGDKMSINEQAVQALANSKIDLAEQNAYLEAMEVLSGKAMDENAESAKNAGDAEQISADKAATAQNALANLIPMINNATGAWENYARAQADAFENRGGDRKTAENTMNVLHTRLTLLENSRKNIGKMTSNLNHNTRATKSNNRATGGSAKGHKKAGDSAKKHSGATKKNTDAVKKNTEALKNQQKALQDEVDKYETVIDYIKKKVSDYIDEMEKARDKETNAIDKQIDDISKLADERDDYYQKQIDNINDLASKEEEYYDKKIDQIQAVNDEIEDNIQLQQLLDNLEKAKKTKVKVYHEGQGFIYDTDQNAVNEAQKELDDYKRQKQVDAEIKALENERDTKKAIYDQQVKDLENRQKKEKDSFDLQTKQLEKHKEEVEKHYNDIIKYWQDWNDQFEKQVNSYKEHQDALLAQQLTGIDFENRNWTTRIGNLNNFVNQYQQKLAQLEEMTRRVNEATRQYEEAQARQQAAMGGGGGGGYSGGGGGGSHSGGGGSVNVSRAVSNAASRVVNAAVSGVVSMFSPVGRVYTWRANTPYERKEGKSWKSYRTQNGDHGFKVTSESGQWLYGTSHKGNHIRIKKSDAIATNRKNAYSTGVSSIDENEIAFVGDSPNTNELVIGSKLNGTPLSMKKGTGVVNAKATNTLAGLLNQLSTNPTQTTNTINNNHGGNQTFVVENVTINGSQIKDVQTFANALLNIRGEAMQRAYKK